MLIIQVLVAIVSIDGVGVIGVILFDCWERSEFRLKVSSLVGFVFWEQFVSFECNVIGVNIRNMRHFPFAAGRQQ